MFPSIRVRNFRIRFWSKPHSLSLKIADCRNAAINVMPEGGGGPRDEVGTLNVLGHPRWGILANFEHKCWSRDRLNNVKTTKANKELGYKCSGILNVLLPEFPEVRTVQLQ